MRPAGGNASKRVADTSPGPWKEWRNKTRHGRAIRFIETYCAPAKGKGHGKPLKLAGFQKRWLKEALADGTEIAVLETPRGNGKSTFGGALAVWAVFDDEETGAPQVPVIATTVKQAIRSCYGAAVSMIRRNPELMSRALIFTGFADPRVEVPFNDGELFPISNDEEGLQGLDPSIALADEMGFQPVGSWTALKSASGKRERSLTVGVGTPGLDRDNAMYHLRKAHREEQRPGIVFHEYAAPEGCALDDRRAWRTGNPAIRSGFLRPSALEADLPPFMPEARFRIFRLGQWYDGGKDSWLGKDARNVWEGLTNPWDFVDGASTWVGVDIALKRDTSAVVAVQQRKDVHPETGEPRLRYHAMAKVWIPTEDEPVDVTDVMQHLRELADRYQVEAISYDPRFFDVPAKLLGDEGLTMVEVPQSLERMTMAVGGLYEAIVKGQITHDGDERFAEHVINAVPRFNERGFTLAKSKNRRKIDAVIALALAYDRVQRQEVEPELEPMVALR